jgi:hypothetical protein
MNKARWSPGSATSRTRSTCRPNSQCLRRRPLMPLRTTTSGWRSLGSQPISPGRLDRTAAWESRPWCTSRRALVIGPAGHDFNRSLISGSALLSHATTAAPRRRRRCPCSRLCGVQWIGQFAPSTSDVSHGT